MIYKLGKKEKFIKKVCSEVSIGGRSIAIFYTNNKFYALTNICPHRGAELCKGDLRGTMLPSEPKELVYGFENEVVVCPWHGYEFDVKSGKALFDTTKYKLKTYQVFEENDELFIKM